MQCAISGRTRQHAQPHTAYDSNELNRRWIRLWGLNAGGLTRSRRQGVHDGRNRKLLGSQARATGRRLNRWRRDDLAKLHRQRSTARRRVRVRSKRAISSGLADLHQDVSWKGIREGGEGDDGADGRQPRRGRRLNVSISLMRPFLHVGHTGAAAVSPEGSAGFTTGPSVDASLIAGRSTPNKERQAARRCRRCRFAR